MRLLPAREADVKRARKELSDYVMSCDTHGITPDAAKMAALHGEVSRLKATVQPVADAVDYLQENGYAEMADRIVLGLEGGGFHPDTWLRECQNLSREDLLAQALVASGERAGSFAGAGDANDDLDDEAYDERVALYQSRLLEARDSGAPAEFVSAVAATRTFLCPAGAGAGDHVDLVCYNGVTEYEVQVPHGVTAVRATHP